jgi:hippurate hydrolase
MAVINRIAEWQEELTAWRRDLHAHPELAFEEVRTAAFVAEKLRAFGVDEVHTGIAGTGVVGVLRSGGGSRSVALRCDMDALPIAERTGAAHASRIPGKMHACGHDGHTTMLLGAARYLAETRRFDGTVYLIFQPAEEGRGGSKRMIEEGLFERFPADAVYGLHNWPSLPVGAFAMSPGPAMAAALNALVGREVDPVDQAVVSITKVAAGDTFNVVPEEAVLLGTVRTFRAATRDRLESRIGEVVAGIATATGLAEEVHYHRGYPPTINHAREAAIGAEVAAEIAGEAQVDRAAPPSMGAEDFAFMLEERPGAYIRMGNGSDADGRVLHSPHYDFNDAALPFGISYWVRLAERCLPAG